MEIVQLQSIRSKNFIDKNNSRLTSCNTRILHKDTVISLNEGE